MPLVFLSHSSRDKAIAQRMAVDLLMSGINVWFDEWDICVGQSITQRVEKGLYDADFVVVLLTEHSVTSGWVQKEWRSRIADEANSQSIHILPVLAEDCEIPRLLRDKKYADIRSDYPHGLQDLIASIRQHVGDEKVVSGGARIESGQIVYDRIVPDIPILKDLISTIRAGCFERVKNGLRAHVQIVASHRSLQELNERLGLDHLTLTSSDYCISTSQSSPTVFSGRRRITIPAGEIVPDISTGARIKMPFTVSGMTITSVSCVEQGGTILGTFTQTITYDGPIQIPQVLIEGQFRVVVSL